MNNLQSDPLLSQQFEAQQEQQQFEPLQAQQQLELQQPQQLFEPQQSQQLLSPQPIEQPQHTQSPLPQAQIQHIPQNNSQVLRYWDINDHHEIYLIKPESLKKSYDNIVKKLQKERVKFLKKTQNMQTSIDKERPPNIGDEEATFLPREVENQVELDSKALKESFSFVKDLFWKKYQTKQLLNQKQQKLKKNLDSIQEQLRLENLKELKDSEIAQYYHHERQKFSQQNSQMRKQ